MRHPETYGVHLGEYVRLQGGQQGASVLAPTGYSLSQPLL